MCFDTRHIRKISLVTTVLPGGLVIKEYQYNDRIPKGYPAENIEEHLISPLSAFGIYASLAETVLFVLGTAAFVRRVSS